MTEKFIEYMKEQGVSENTYSSYASDIKIFKKYYEDSYGEELQKLIRGDIRDYISYLCKIGMSPKTINRKIAAIKQYNLFLIEEKIQDEVVIIDKDYIKVQKSMLEKEIPTEQEINKIKHATYLDKKFSKRDNCMAAILIYGGLRESEGVYLRLVDIRLNDRLINVVGKGNKFRQVVINNIMYEAISNYLEERKQIETSNPYLFVGQKNISTDKPLNRNSCYRFTEKYKEICKIEKLHPHMFRSFFCTNALHNAGYDIDQVANQAGHSSLNTTRQYIATDKKSLFELANKL